ncbi:Tripartite tricarboxylate transporter family receptor [compost metagenome]
MLAPAGTPKAIVDRLHDATATVMSTDEVRAVLLEAGLTLSLSSQDEFRNLLKTESAKWGTVVEQTGANVN